jgi:hypothetical protein
MTWSSTAKTVATATTARWHDSGLNSLSRYVKKITASLVHVMARIPFDQKENKPKKELDYNKIRLGEMRKRDLFPFGASSDEFTCKSQKVCMRASLRLYVSLGQLKF